MPADYVCPRCDYRTINKVDMRRHFSRKRLCPDESDLTLTDEIKQAVLDNHKYYPPKKPEKIVNINNNNNNNTSYNAVINLFNELDWDEKMNLFLDYKQQKTLDFEDGLEKRFENRVKRLQENKYRGGYFLDMDGLMQLVDDITIIKNGQLDTLNILFDRVIKRFRLYRSQEWEVYLEDIGVKLLIRLLKSYYLDTYELYLIKNLHSDQAIILNRYKLEEHLKLYYRFIATFDITPFIEDSTDEEVLGHQLVEDNDSYLAEKYVGVYWKEKRDLKQSEKNNIIKKIVNIVKGNTIQNLSCLNKKVLELLKIDESFRETLIELKES